MYLDQQLSMQEISRVIGSSRQRIARWMKFWNIPARLSGDGMRIILKKKTGSRSGNWQGGNFYCPSSDTWFTYCPGHPRSKNGHGAVPTHVLTAEKMIGRYIEKNESIHHKDRNRSNNSESNLCVMTKNQHMLLHRALGTVGIKMIYNGMVELVLSLIADEAIKNLIIAVYVENRICTSRM